MIHNMTSNKMASKPFSKHYSYWKHWSADIENWIIVAYNIDICLYRKYRSCAQCRTQKSHRASASLHVLHIGLALVYFVQASPVQNTRRVSYIVAIKTMRIEDPVTKPWKDLQVVMMNSNYTTRKPYTNISIGLYTCSMQTHFTKSVGLKLT